MVMMITDTTMEDAVEVTTVVDVAVTMVVDVAVTTVVVVVEATTVAAVEEDIAGMVVAVVDDTTTADAGAAALLQRQLLTNKLKRLKLTTDISMHVDGAMHRVTLCSASTYMCISTLVFVSYICLLPCCC